MSTPYDPQGVQPGQVGPTFDIAIGFYNPSTELVTMVGYVVSPSGQSQEGTDVTDDQHIVQIASPNSSDRFARFPQVSQGDWTHGERQRVYTSGNMYYESDGGVDVSTPGNLTLFPNQTQTGIVPDGEWNRIPLQTDGGSWYLGINTSGAGNNIAKADIGGITFSRVANGLELLDLLYVPWTLVGLTQQGLWAVTPPTSQQFVSDSINQVQLAVKSLAYFDDVVYYIANRSPGTSEIKGYTRSTNSTQTYLTAVSSEPFYQCICSTASGIFFTTSSNLPFLSNFYTWDGISATPVRVAQIQGRVEYAVEALGTIYVLCRQFQPTYTFNPAWTLYSVVGNQVSVVDDARWVTDPNFSPTCTSVDTYSGVPGTHGDFSGMLWSDGRFLYIAWPGMATRRIDLVNGGISQIGPNTSGGEANVHARRFLTSATVPYIDVSSFSSPGNAVIITRMYGTPTTGQITSSFMDFDSPGQGKIFRSIEFQSFEPLVGNQALAFSYRLDQNSAFTPLTTQQVGTRSFVAPFPTGTIGTEIQVQCVITADSSDGAPILTSWTVVADQGRIETYTLSCRRNQQYRSQDQVQGDYQQYTGQELQANLLNVRNIAGGYGYAFIPDPAASNGVSEIQFQILDIQRTTPQGAATGLRQVDGDLDMECDVVFSFIEFFPPQ